MGLLLSILFSYVGAMELILVVRDIVHQVGLHHERKKLNRNPSSPFSLHDIQQNIRKSIKSAQEQLHETESIQSMADGIQYEQGYRIPSEGEKNTLKRWMEARANITIEPSHNLILNSLENNCGTETTAVAKYTQNDDSFIKDDSLRSSSLSVETIIENRKNVYQVNSDELRNNAHLIDDDDGDDDYDYDYDDDDDGDGDDVHPNIHFNEYSQDYLHALDGIAKKGQRKNEESRRRKSYKMFTSGHSGGDILLRRRSEDIDGETDNPWGELNPESFHDDGLWKRERAMSIAENEEIMAFVDDKSCIESFKQDLKTPLNSSSENKNEKASGLHGKRNSDVSSENQFISNDNSEENVQSDGKNIEKIRKLPEIFVDGSDMAVEDSKTNEFIDFLEHIDNDEATVTSRFQFKEYLEQPKRLHYPSYNNDDDKYNEDELKDFSIVERVDYEPKDLANENKSSNFNSKRAINNRKPNMFALATPKHLNDDENNSQYMYRPVIRITSTEDERVEQFLYDENCEKINAAKDHCAAEILIKSKTTQMFDCSDENTSDVETIESENSRANSPSLDLIRRESLLSDGDSEPIQFECEQSTDPKHFYNREDSSSSNKSNVLFERSQSRFSELEYIKGRDDWKDSYLHYDISKEIDSDNYHHLRRHSEAADTLEYIRGREDWLRNELHHAPRNSLPRIFETGEQKIVIQDQIDSDEYHHNFFLSETFNSISGITEQKEKSFNDSQTYDFGEIESDKVNCSNDMDSNISEYCRTNIEVVSSREGSMVSPENVTFNGNNKITEAIEDLITHETTNSEDIEITVLDLVLDMVSDQKEKIYNPFIVISEATDDNLMPDTSNPEPIEIPASFGYTDTKNTLCTESIRTENYNRNSDIQSNDTNQLMTSEILSEAKYQGEHGKEMDLEKLIEGIEVTQRNNRGIRAKSEMMSQSLLKPNEEKPRRNLSFENVEDLIRDVTNGPWFHK